MCNVFCFGAFDLVESVTSVSKGADVLSDFINPYSMKDMLCDVYFIYSLYIIQYIILQHHLKSFTYND